MKESARKNLGRDRIASADTESRIFDSRSGNGSGRSMLLLGGGLLIIAILSLTVYVTFDQSSNAFSQVPQSAAAQTSDSNPPAVSPSEDREPSIISQLFGSAPVSSVEPARDGLLMRAAKMALRLLVAALLAAMLAYRPSRKTRLLRRNPYVAETQILLAVVASALMMIVADNAARAFGIFAAASLVRFRTNIRDPKETTVLLINLAIGLAAGVGRFELALMFAVFVLATLWILERYESKQLVRSMQLKVKSHNVVATDEIIRRILDTNHISAEMREMDREDEDHPLGRLVYYTTISTTVNTDQLSEEIFSADARNVDTIEWHQKKSTDYPYR